VVIDTNHSRVFHSQVQKIKRSVLESGQLVET